MKNRVKTFDSVRTMREIRDSLSYEEQKRYMREKSQQGSVKGGQAKIQPTPPP